MDPSELPGTAPATAVSSQAPTWFVSNSGPTLTTGRPRAHGAMGFMRHRNDDIRAKTLEVSRRPASFSPSLAAPRTRPDDTSRSQVSGGSPNWFQTERTRARGEGEGREGGAAGWSGANGGVYGAGAADRGPGEVYSEAFELFEVAITDPVEELASHSVRVESPRRPRRPAPDVGADAERGFRTPPPSRAGGPLPGGSPPRINGIEITNKTSAEKGDPQAPDWFGKDRGPMELHSTNIMAGSFEEEEGSSREAEGEKGAGAPGRRGRRSLTPQEKFHRNLQHTPLW